jgi:Flp pilus assembly protein TadD
LRPDSRALSWCDGGFLDRQNRYQEAEAAFTQASSRVPANARLWSSLGGTRLARGRPEEARAALERSTELQPVASAASNLATIDGKFSCKLKADGVHAQGESDPVSIVDPPCP